MRSRPAASSAAGPDIIRYLGDAAGVVLALGLTLAPAPYGSVEPWAAAGLAVVVAAALLLAAPGVDSPRPLRAVAAPAAALAGLALLGLLQSAPLPGALVALLSPEHARLWAETAAALPAGDGLSSRLTLSPGNTRATALTLAVLAAALVAAAAVGRRRLRRRWLLAGLLGGVAFQLLYGYRHWLAGSREIWGHHLPAMAERLRGTYVNPNHLAYLLELGLAAAFAWAWWAAHRGRREHSAERRILLVAPPALVWLALFVTLAFTRSRAGLLAAVAAAAVQGVFVAARGRRWHLAPVGVAVAAGGVAVVALVGLQPGLGRLLATPGYEVAAGARARVVGLTLDLWGRYPLTGSGLGTFRDAFFRVVEADMWTGAWYHAHNGYAELLATGGLVAAVLVLAGAVGLARRLLDVLRRGRRSEDRAAALAALGGVAAVAVHEAFDFGLTLPANAFALAVLCGAAAGAPLLRHEAVEGDAVAGHRHHLDDVEAAPGRRR